MHTAGDCFHDASGHAGHYRSDAHGRAGVQQPPPTPASPPSGLVVRAGTASCERCRFSQAYAQNITPNSVYLALDTVAAPPLHRWAAEAFAPLDRRSEARGPRQLFRTLGLPIPPWQMYLANNKMSTCMTSWLLGNTLAQNLVSTGAFEVYYDGNLIFSKLTTGKLPVVPPSIHLPAGHSPFARAYKAGVPLGRSGARGSSALLSNTRSSVSTFSQPTRFAVCANQQRAIHRVLTHGMDPPAAARHTAASRRLC